MSDVAIRVDGLSKRYRLGARQGYRTLRESLTWTGRCLLRRLSGTQSEPKAIEHFWALNDVSFEANRGDVIGIIGRNGAGKSTLLKVLSRITEPTQGRVEMYGRVGSLLEVGTGFHPELTGRENIYLNGAILGMQRAEIDKSLDEIIAFAEIEKFVDTPVKHYSSGMYLRLAFAVGAHLDTEILIVDEVLAVGDLEFQRKCLGKVENVANTGRTVLLVSHAMASIESICSSAILLESGRVTCTGPAKMVIDRYISGFNKKSTVLDLSSSKVVRRGSGEARVISCQLLDADQEPCADFTPGSDLTVRFVLEGQRFCSQFLAVVIVKTASGINVLHVPNPPDIGWTGLSAGETITVDCTVPDCGLYPGKYLVSIWLGKNPSLEMDWVPDVCSFEMGQGELSRYGFDMSWAHGIYFCQNKWTILRDNAVPFTAFSGGGR